ncbi:flavin reductase family protein [Sporosarcina sp. FSL W7-1349]|uniref:flavin reductase family protein n=1 Tax=Sporosarcina sp. FSL W7-1349 TaxID=2921561 RepID=UPI0030F7ABE6
MKVKNKEMSEQLFKEVMGSYPSGVTVITTIDQKGNPIGLTANSFVSVSIEPLLVLWCIDKRANSYSAFGPADKFAVNILAADQAEACWTFASKTEADRFGKQDWSLSENGLPILTGSFASLECKKVQEVDAGDHYILIGEVIDIEKSELDPMLYFKRKVGAVPLEFGSQS